MTAALYLEDAYQRDAHGIVTAITEEGGIVLDGSIFYPTGGGQPGDSGWLTWDGKRLPIATTVKGQGDDIALVPAEPLQMPEVGTHVTQVLDWDRRHKHMRVHTMLHLLSVAVPFGVTGGQISARHGRLDFDMPDIPQNREEIEQTLNDYVAQDARVSEDWITAAALEENPHLVKTMAVRPPKGIDRLRLIRIGEADNWLDVQACGGTHVARTGEIGALRLGKIEKKGRWNRRVYIHLDS